MIVLDTTVLVYAVGNDHPLRRPCRRIIERIGSGELAATTTLEVLQEFVHVRARRRGRQDAARLASSFISLTTPLCAPDEADLGVALDLFVAHGALGAFDAVLAATVLGSDRLTGLVSADRAFGTVPRLDHLDPADAGAMDRLGA